MYHNPDFGDMNLEQTIQLLVEVMSAFPNTIILEDDMLAEGDKVLTRYTMKQTQKGTFRGIPATGKKFVTEDIHIHRIAKGKIAEVWTYMDTYSMMTQLGLIPAAPKK